MGFNEDLVDGMEELFEFAGQEAILTRNSVDTPCHVDVLKGVDLQPDGFITQVSGTQTIIELLLSEIETEPARGDTVTVGSDEYIIDSTFRNDGFSVQVIVKPA